MNSTSSRIKKVFLHNLIERIKELSAVEPGKDADNIWYQHIHSIVGTAGTIGFSAVSEKLLPWEKKLAPYKDSREQLSDEDITELKNILVYLSDFIRENDAYLVESDEKELKSQAAFEGRVLIIDDEKAVYERVKELLGEINLEVFWADSGQGGLEELEKNNFDLILLDINLPDINGFMLFQIIKENPRWEWLPIIFLSIRASVSDRVEGLELGADDYISKPFDGEELQARVKNRLLKSGKIMKGNTRDYLTGAYTREYFDDILKSQIAHASRYGDTFSIAMLDLDNFKRVNDTYGHLIGDEVLKKLVAVIKEEVRTEDVLARYGGEEFVLLLSDTGWQNAIEKVNGLIKKFARVDFSDQERKESFRVTFSAGIAEYKLDGLNPKDLLLAADNALYQAKNEGKARAEAASDNPKEESQLEGSRILLLDDNLIVLKYIKRELAANGLEVDSFTSPLEVLEVIQEGKWQVALVDINMPEMNGFEFIGRLKEKMGKKTPPIIILTTSSSLAEVTQAHELGIRDYVVKPFDIWDLTSRIYRIIKNR